MNAEEYAIMFEVEDRHWWYGALRGMLDEFWRRHVSPEIRNPQSTIRNLIVLDVGCGTGAVLQWLSGQEGVTPFGIDFSMPAVQYCRKRAQDRTAVASALALPFPAATFDAVVCLDVLCHKSIPDKRAALHEIRETLKPGGVLFINVPAYQWLYSSHDAAVHTDRRFTRREIVTLLAECQFEILEATYWNTLLFPAIVPVRLWRKIVRPQASDLAGGTEGATHRLFSTIMAFERRLIRVMPLPFGLSIFVAARKRG